MEDKIKAMEMLLKTIETLSTKQYSPTFTLCELRNQLTKIVDSIAKEQCRNDQTK